jgi:two-component system KDP operon response regulator KdpE
MSTGRVLVIDDEPQIRRIMRETLTSAGYEVDDARNGVEGLEKLRKFHPDLILLDTVQRYFPITSKSRSRRTRAKPFWTA